MTIETAKKVVDFIFRHAPADRKMEIGFFGGEPLLKFDLIEVITRHIEQFEGYAPDRVKFSLTTNGNIFSDPIAQFLAEHDFKVCVSCDGPPWVQDVFRRTPQNESCAATVETTLRKALRVLPTCLVNAVYHPATFRHLPETVDYLSGLGLRQIYLNPDFSAPWTQADADDLMEVYEAIAQRYIAWYLQKDPHFISLIDSKIAVLIRQGFDPQERCQMGRGEMAFATDGSIYPCERLFAYGTSNRVCIGHVQRGLDLSALACRSAPGDRVNGECLSCGIKDYCVNWCGCSNFFMTGYYNRVGPFQCASEKASIQVASKVFEELEKKLGPVFLHHLSGQTHLNSRFRPENHQETLGNSGQAQ